MEHSPNNFSVDFVFFYLKLICMSLNVAAWIKTQKYTQTSCKCYCRVTIRQTSLITILPASWCWQKHSQPLLPSAHPACLFTNSATKERKKTNSQTKQWSRHSLFCHCLHSPGGGKLKFLPELTHAEPNSYEIDFMDEWTTCKPNLYFISSAPSLVFQILLS